MALGGYADRVAHVDLTKGQIDYQAIPENGNKNTSAAAVLA